ncbi:MAG: argininosuccinate synthase [Nitrososphaeria archaeon]
MIEKIILAYSGGLDTSVAVRWLQEKYEADVVTLTVNLGQGIDLQEVANRSRFMGSVSHHDINGIGEFAQDYVCPSITANGLYEEKYPLSTALGRPLIAEKLVKIAEMEDASTVAHGCTGKGNDQVRFDVTVRALNPKLRVVAPIREWNLTRDQEIEYAEEHGVHFEPKKAGFSIDQNLWGRSIEGGALEDPNFEPPPDIFEWVKPPEETPDKPGYVEIDFEEGVPVALNGHEMNASDLIASMNEVAGLHGVGVIDHMEDRLVGIKSREVYECPAALCLIEAHKDLEKLVLTRHELSFKRIVEQQWAWLVYSGLWVEPLRHALQSFIEKTQERVAGTVRLKLFKGSFRVVGRESPNSIYDTALATYSGESTFDQKKAQNFIDLWGLPSRIASAKRRKAEVQALT